MKMFIIILMFFFTNYHLYSNNLHDNKITDKMNDTTNKDYSKSIYWMNTSSKECQYEVFINDISAFRSIADYEEDANDCSMQINSFLKNGVNNVTIKMYPLFKKEKLFGAAAEVRVLHYPKNEFHNKSRDKIITSHDMNNKTICEKISNLSFYESSDTFEVKNIPEIDGWKNSVNLTKENKDALKKELYAFYTDIYQILKNKDLKGYLELIKEREKYLDWVHCFKSTDAESHLKAIEETIVAKGYHLQPLPSINEVFIRLEAYGKLVSFVDKDGRDIIQYFYEDEEVKRLSLM